MPGEVKPVGLAGDMLVPQSDDHIARLAEIEAIRALSYQVGNLATKIDGFGDKIMGMHSDIAVLKAQHEGFSEFKGSVEANKRRIELLEFRNAREDGERSVLTWLFKHWPAIAAIIVSALALFGVKIKP